MSDATPTELIVACRTANVAQAHAIAARLNNAGVEARVVGEFLKGGYGLTAGGMSDVEVWIAKSDRAAAEALIAEVMQPAPAQHEPTAMHHPPDPGGIRFSILFAMMVLTMAAVIAAAGAVRPENLKAYSETLYLSITLVVVCLIYRRWTRIFLAPVKILDEEI